MAQQLHSQLRILVFINGNRGPKADKEISDNKLYEKDKTGYWYSYDDTIISRFQPTKAVYFDGHFPVRYSMHRTNLRFAKAYIFSRFCWISKKSRWVFNHKFNPEGFNSRVESGRIAARNLIDYFQKNKFNTQEITLDFVTHSMGYAYSIGMIEELTGKVRFGKMLSIAPESAAFKGFDLSLFEEVWQYGCNMEGDGEAICWQDGIAPQTGIPGIDKLPKEKGGRVFIPKEWPKKNRGFVKTHHLNWFQWFYLIQPNHRGYFKP